MQYFGLSNNKKILKDKKYLPMAKLYWGVGPLPMNSEIIGGYSDEYRAGALIKLKSGQLVCGNAGCICHIMENKR